MRNTTVIAVDPVDFQNDERDLVEAALEQAAANGTIDLELLPEAVRAVLIFALEAVARGEQVAVVASGEQLTVTEAAQLVGVSRTHLTGLCQDGRVPSRTTGGSLLIESATVMTILRERGRLHGAARDSVASAERRRRSRVARAACDNSVGGSD